MISVYESAHETEICTYFFYLLYKYILESAHSHTYTHTHITVFALMVMDCMKEEESETRYYTHIHTVCIGVYK